MPQSHHTPGSRTGCSRAVLNKNRTSTHGARTGPVWRRTNFASPYGARRFLMHALQAYGPRTGFDIVTSPWTAREGTVRGPCRPRTAKYDDRARFLPIVVVSIPLRVRRGAVRHPCKSHARVPYRSRRIWRTLKIPVRGPYDARRGIARGTFGVLWIIQPNHKYVDVSSRTGPVARCDHGNSTDAKFLRGLHLALRARNRTGDKNRMGPVVGCDWGIT